MHVTWCQTIAPIARALLQGELATKIDAFNLYGAAAITELLEQSCESTDVAFVAKAIVASATSKQESMLHIVSQAAHNNPEKQSAFFAPYFQTGAPCSVSLQAFYPLFASLIPEAVKLVPHSVEYARMYIRCHCEKSPPEEGLLCIQSNEKILKKAGFEL